MTGWGETHELEMALRHAGSRDTGVSYEALGAESSDGRRRSQAHGDRGHQLPAQRFLWEK